MCQKSMTHIYVKIKITLNEQLLITSPGKKKNIISTIPPPPPLPRKETLNYVLNSSSFDFPQGFTTYISTCISKHESLQSSVFWIFQSWKHTVYILCALSTQHSALEIYSDRWFVQLAWLEGICCQTHCCFKYLCVCLLVHLGVSLRV